MLKKVICASAVVCVWWLALDPAAAQSPAAPAQQSAAAVVAEPEAPRVVLQAETTASVLRLMKFSGALRDRADNPRSGTVGLTFALYKDQQGGSPLWLEVHNAQLDEQGRYTVLLGSTKGEGLPLELFSSGEARWLGVQVNLPGEEEQPRVLLVSVPYALKAADAETLGGKPPSAFLLAEKAEGRETAEAKPGAGKAESAKEAVKEGPGREQVVGTITGEGTLNMVSKFTGANTIGNGSIFDNGSVGIGTTSPTARLHVFEPEPSLNANVRLMGSGQTGSWMDIFAGTAVGFGLFGYGAQPFIFGTSGLERVRITPAGNVGIGTTNPGVRLHIYESEPSQNANVRLMGSGQTGSWMDIFAGTAVGFGLFGYGAQPFIFGTDGQERARITATGNMGVGTTTPAQKLDVAGNILASGSVTAASGNISGNLTGSQLVSNVANGTAPLVVTSTTKVANLNADSLDGLDSAAFAVVAHNHDAAYVNVSGDSMVGPLNLPANGLVVGANQLVVSGGNVGIGTTTPSSILSLRGDTSNETIARERAPGIVSGGHLTVQAGGAGSGASNQPGGTLFLSGGIATGFGDSGIEFKTATGGASGTADRTPSRKMLIDGTGNVELEGDVPLIFGMRRPSSTDGKSLTVRAAGAPSDLVFNTDKSGGTLFLSGGIATGTGSSKIEFQTATGGASGHDDRNPTTKMTMDGTGNLGIGTDPPGYRLDVADRIRLRQGISPSAGIWFYQTTPAADQAFVGMQDDTHVGFYGSTGSPGFRLTVDTTSGNVAVTGTLTKAGGSFKIDHPADPANKYLSHSFVESPDMMNIYNGVATLDARGQAWINLPDWFEALNRDFRYQLTAIGAPGPNLYIAEKVRNRRFKIAGGKAGMEVSWQVTGIRQDAYAQAHRIPVEEEKPEGQRGYYLHPELFGQPAERGIQWSGNKKPLRDLEEDRRGALATAQRPGR